MKPKGIKLTEYYPAQEGGRFSIIKMYSEMITNATFNIGKFTDSGVLITENLTNKFKERRDELEERNIR